MRSLLLALGALLIFSNSLAFGQKEEDLQDISYSANRKISGNYWRPYTARSYHRTAIEHAQVLTHYGQTYDAVPLETAKEHIAEVRRALDSAKTEFGKLSGYAKKDKEVAKHLAAIQAHQAKAHDLATGLEAEVKKEKPSTETIVANSKGIDKELKAAEVEHEKLQKHLKVEKFTEAKS